MTESEWVKCTDPDEMLDYLRRCRRFKVSDRKLRLYTCACIRRAWTLLRDKCFRTCVEIGERFADRQARKEELDAAYLAACDAAYRVTMKVPARNSACHASSFACCEGVADGAAVAGRFLSDTLFGKGAQPPESTVRELNQQAVLLREIMGNPFRPTILKRSRRMFEAVALAKTIYENRSFEHLPMLAELLEKTGCNDADILDHCRGSGPHVRGCWVVDMVLGKQ